MDRFASAASRWPGRLRSPWSTKYRPEALRDRMRRDVVTLLPELATWISLDLAWGQRYAVTTLCRMLYTLDTARVCSKKAALLWAARPGSVEQTIAGH